jgi:hypothetical protein
MTEEQRSGANPIPANGGESNFFTPLTSYLPHPPLPLSRIEHDL